MSTDLELAYSTKEFIRIIGTIPSLEYKESSHRIAHALKSPLLIFITTY